MRTILTLHEPLLAVRASQVFERWL
jgi:hypothetical protein